MTPNPVPSIPSRTSVPSREEVENVAKQIPQPIGQMLRALLAKVERLTLSYNNLHWDYNCMVEDRNLLRATVAQQAEALAALRKAT